MESRLGTVDRPLDAHHITGYVLACDLHDNVQRSLYYTGTFEPRTTALIEAALLPGDIFVDVGANVGHYTLIAAAAVGARGHVHAIEASATTAERLRHTILRNDLFKSVSIHVIAAADCPYKAALRAVGDDTSVGLRHIRPDGHDSIVEHVQAAPLDDVLADVRAHVVKIDVEGADLRALIGMRRLLERARPRLVVAEAQDPLLGAFGDSVEAMDDYMRTLDYTPQAFREPGHAPSRAYKPRHRS
jgi:FkbM family methyltransferase